MKHMSKKQSGQSILLIAFALITLVALLALVVDAGNAYVQERKFENAVSAGSQAGALALARNYDSGTIATAIGTDLQSNHVDPSKTSAYYVVQDSGGNEIVARLKTIQSFGSAIITQTQAVQGGQLLPVVGVQVEGNTSFPTYFAGMVGWRQMQVGGATASFALCGASTAFNVFPIAIDKRNFLNNQVNFGQTYLIYENSSSNTNNYHYLTWNTDTTASNLVTNMDVTTPDVDHSGNVNVNTSYEGIPQSSASMYNNSNVYQKLQAVQAAGTWFTVPVYDTTSTSNGNTYYHIYGFARAQITNLSQGKNGQNGVYGSLTLVFKLWIDPDNMGANVQADYGVCSVKTHPGTTHHRDLAITVTELNLTPNSKEKYAQVPVDVVNVIDLSTSMGESFGSESKVQAARDALKTLTGLLHPNSQDPSKGDQAALVTFPKKVTSGTYNYNSQKLSGCSNGSTNEWDFANPVDPLTPNTTKVMSDTGSLQIPSGIAYTPGAAGLQLGLQTVLGTGHYSKHVAVIIYASDGLANYTVDGKWTGFVGMTSPPPSCDSQAIQDLSDQGIIASQDPLHTGAPQALVFSIALGDTFDDTSLKSIASSPWQTHYYRTTTASDMNNIYSQIGQRLENIGSECLPPTKSTIPAGGASLTITPPSGSSFQVTLDDSGKYTINDAQNGTYTFTYGTVTDSSTGYVYNIFTDSDGGALTNPTVTVPIEDASYPATLLLTTASYPSCP